jgi:NAD(P)-dependent dehydrogenase (short-subunit alcohol dehydrogenase family)
MNTDRVVVVTGAAGGMGALIVKGFFASGDTVFATTSTRASKPCSRRLFERTWQLRG